MNEKRKDDMHKFPVRLTAKEILTIPNLMSALRLVLAVLFWRIYTEGGIEENRNILTALMLISAVSDFLDGKIARRFHMVSEVGKLLDPLADKVTQGVLLLCLFSKYPVAKPLFVLFLFAQCCMIFMGARTIVLTQKNEGAKWYGKVNTAVFYVVMLLLVMIPGISDRTANVMMLVSGACMIAAILLYMRQFAILHREQEA